MLLVCLAICLMQLQQVEGNALFATTSGWQEVVYANTQAELSGVAPEPELSVKELRGVFKSVWTDTHRLCPTLPKEGHRYVDVGFDTRLLAEDQYARVLGWATRSEILFQGTWTSALTSQTVLQESLNIHTHYLGKLRVAKAPPGGWWRSTEGLCRSKFRLQDILLHEIMHIVGISTTIRRENEVLVAGSPFHGICFPSDFDVNIRNASGYRLVDHRCEVQIPLEKGPFYVNGVELYQHEEQFFQGTSLSHSANPGALLTASVGACLPEGPRNLTDIDGKLFESIGVACAGLTSAEASAWRVSYPQDDEERPSTAQNLSPEKSAAQSEAVDGVDSETPPARSAAWRRSTEWWGFAATAACLASTLSTLSRRDDLSQLSK
ncbi:MAG: hypothetical protein CL967_05650 [Euryarchaeota archaeon]|nr:hypothetical protein [Euryarchaeota archaeon]